MSDAELEPGASDAELPAGSRTPGPMQRVSVVGSSGSGKTTFARRLAARLGVPHIELDALHWEPGWQHAEPAVFRERVDRATVAPGWVCDGNYADVRPIVLERADTVVWLDLPLATCLVRIVRRTFHGVRSGKELWSGNHESWRLLLLGRSSLVWWLVTTHGRRQRDYEARFGGGEWPRLRVHRFRRNREADAWLAAVGGSPVSDRASGSGL